MSEPFLSNDAPETVGGFLESVPFENIAVGSTASVTRTLTQDRLLLFASSSGDINPAHLDQAYAENSFFHRIIAHGMWTGSLISAVFGTILPGPGTIYLSQSLRFIRPVNLGDVITASVVAREKRDEKRLVVFDCRCVNQRGEKVLEGTAEVIAPAEKVRLPRRNLPEIQVRRHERQAQWVAMCKTLSPIKTAIVHPCDRLSLEGAIAAKEAGLIVPVLVGNEEKIRATALRESLDIDGYAIVPALHSHDAAIKAVALAVAGEVGLLMKGSLHTDELMHAVAAPESGLRTARRMSHAFVMDVPAYKQPLIITDAAVNIYPTLDEKRDIVQNAIDFAFVLGFREPKVALLSAAETVSPKIISTIDAAALCKMADRGQISGGILDGPLAFDDAISAEIAREKGIVSSVAGQALIFVVPDLESGNMLAKQLLLLAGAEAAGIVLGARIPIILTSRADTLRTRVASAAIAVLAAHGRGAVSS